MLIAFFLPMMTGVLLTQEKLGMPGALAVGWVVYLAMLIPYWTLSLARDASAPSA